MGKPTGFMEITRQTSLELPPEERIRNFNEFHVPLHTDEQQAQGARCMDCGVPFCQSGVQLGGMFSGCPLNNLIPEWNDLVYQGKWDLAVHRLIATNRYPEFTSRVCPALCEAACTCGDVTGSSVTVRENEHAIVETGYAKGWLHAAPPPARTGKSVAVIGSGPAGLACASDLAKAGYEVTIFEALHKVGGVLVYGIPEFRLPKEKIVAREVEAVKKLGVEIETDVIVGRTVTIDELMNEEGYEAVFIGSGAGLPRFMGIPGENLNGVVSANEFLTRINLMKAYREGAKTPIQHARNVAVVGGGNVAMDAARCAKRLGAENVYIVYRRSMNELPARKEEVEHAEEEGIIFKTLCNPVAIHPDEDGFVHSMTCIEMELGEPDASGRRRPIEKQGSEFELEVDTVIMSLGTSPNPLIRSTTPGLETNKHGCIVTDGDDGKTSRDGVYAGGDAVTGAATVIKAMGAGKDAAVAIDAYLKAQG